VELYEVILSGFKRGEEFFRGRLMKQGMKIAQIERVIAAVPCVLKKGLSLDEAKRFEDLFRAAGGIVQVRLEGVPVAPDEDITHDRKPRGSQPRLMPLVQPLPAPPEEPPPPTIDLLPQPEPEPEKPAPVAPVPPAPLPARPPAVFRHENPWIFRSLGLAFIALTSIIAVSCVSKYKVGERIHDFSVLVDDQMANDLVGVARKTGGIVGAADLYQLVDRYAKRAHVRVNVHDLQEGFAEIVEGPGGTCTAAVPTVIDRMPHEKRMQWMMKVRRCAAPPWIIGFSVTIEARVGLSKDSASVEQWIFVSDWVPSS
jgi:hypothetical protein